MEINKQNYVDIAERVIKDLIKTDKRGKAKLF